MTGIARRAGTSEHSVTKLDSGSSSISSGGLTGRRRGVFPIAPSPCGRYTLIAKIGHGGMAEVFLAVASGIGGFQKLAVVKRIHPQLLEVSEFVTMFLDEARLAARLSHPNVVETYEVGEHDEIPFMAMEFLEGASLDHVVRVAKTQNEPIPPAIAVSIVSQVLRGLHYAHELCDYDGSPLHVVHRDISPSNVHLTYQGVVKLLDFGIAKATTKLAETRTGRIKGKLGYMAPEQAKGTDVDRRADIWSAGVTLHELCTRQKLFRAESDVLTLHALLTADIDEILTSGPAMPDAIATVVAKALERDPKLRYQTAEEMRLALQAARSSFDASGDEDEIGPWLERIMGERFRAQRAVVSTMLEQSRNPPSVAPPHVTRTVTQLERAPIARPARSRGTVLRGVAAAVVIVAAAASAGWWASSMYPGERTGDEARARERVARGPEAVGHAAAPAQAAATSAAANDAGAAAIATTAGETRRPLRRNRGSGRAEKQRSSEARGAETSGAASTQTRPDTTEASTGSTTETGLLTLITTPWTEVFANGRDLGQTPLIRVRLPSGTHTLSLKNRQAGIDTELQVTIRPGATTTRRIGL